MDDKPRNGVADYEAELDRAKRPTHPAPADTGAGRNCITSDELRGYPNPNPAVGQILEYAAYAIDHWRAEYIAQRTAREQAEQERDRLRGARAEQEEVIADLIQGAITLRSRLTAAAALVEEARWLVSLIDSARVATSSPEAPTSWRRGDYFVHLTRRDEDRIAALRARLAELEGDPMGDLVRETERLGLYPHQQGDRMPGADERMPEVDDGR